MKKLIISLLLAFMLTSCSGVPFSQKATETATPLPTSTSLPVTPTQNSVGWDVSKIIDEKDLFMSIVNGDGYNGREIIGSGVYINNDTRWNIGIKVEPLKEGSAIQSTGVVITGKRKNNTEPTIFLGYSGSSWMVGYAPISPADYTFMKSLDSVTGLNEQFQLSIGLNGKLLEINNKSKVVFSHEFPDPIFPSNLKTTMYTQNGPFSLITISELTLEKKNTESVDYAIYPTPAPEVGIDMEMFYSHPKSYEYLVAHPDEFIQAPDPMTEGVDTFLKWYVDVIVPAMGDRETRVPNIDSDVLFGPPDFRVHCSKGCPLEGQVGFFSFESNGTRYPVYVLTIRYNEQNSPPRAVILVDKIGSQGLGSVDIIYKNNEDFYMMTYIGPLADIAPEIKEMMNQGLVSSNSLFSECTIGFGAINFIPRK